MQTLLALTKSENRSVLFLNSFRDDSCALYLECPPRRPLQEVHKTFWEDPIVFILIIFLVFVGLVSLIIVLTLFPARAAEAKSEAARRDSFRDGSQALYGVTIPSHNFMVADGAEMSRVS